MKTTIDSLTLHYQIVGDGEPMLLIHGFPLSGQMWQPAAERLSGCKCIIPDLRGHGRSDASPQVTIERFSDDLAELLDAIGESRPTVVCGLSMGGVIAFDFFRRYRRRVRALVLTDCRPNAETEEDREQREKLARAVLRSGSRVAADTMIERLFGPAADATLKANWRDVMAAQSPIGVAAAARALASRPDPIPTLRQIDVPTLLIFGEEDVITPPQLAQEMRAAIRGSRLVLIPQAGHLPPVEQPDRFAAALQAFLKTLPP